MGAKSSKCDNVKSGRSELSQEKLQKIGELFKTNTDDKIEITKEKLIKIWQKYLDKELLSSFLNVLFSNKRMFIMFDDLINFYWEACENTVESGVKVIAEIIKTNGNGSKRHEYLSRVISHFIQSYFKICAIDSDSTYNDWIKFGSTHVDATSLTTYLMDSLSGKEIDVQTLEDWNNGNPLFSVISHHVYKTLFNTICLEEKTNLFPEFLPKQGYKSLLSPTELIFIHWHLGQNSIKKWRLLFCVDNDGQSWTTFLKAISAQGPTVIVIHDTKGCIFGAFASQSWNTNPNFYGDDDSFLFTLHPKMEIFYSSGYNKNYQYINSGQATLPNGLGMGGMQNYWGLFLDSNFGNGIVSESCTTFKNYKKLCCDKEFTLDRLQVWGVGTPDPTPQELGERTTSVLDQDPAAVAILELAGRPLHSTEIRKMKPIDQQ